MCQSESGYSSYSMEEFQHDDILCRQHHFALLHYSGTECHLASGVYWKDESHGISPTIHRRCLPVLQLGSVAPSVLRPYSEFPSRNIILYLPVSFLSPMDKNIQAWAVRGDMVKSNKHKDIEAVRGDMLTDGQS